MATPSTTSSTTSKPTGKLSKLQLLLMKRAQEKAEQAGDIALADHISSEREAQAEQATNPEYKPEPAPVISDKIPNLNPATALTGIAKLRATLAAKKAVANTSATTHERHEVNTNVTTNTNSQLPTTDSTNPNIPKPSSVPAIIHRPETLPETESALVSNATGMDGNSIHYNTEQSEFIALASNLQPCVLIGAAGTGKTTCSQGAIKSLLATDAIPTLQADGHSHLTSGTPGILIISYTRRAVNNIRKVQSTDMQTNCITAHKLLEYQPEYYETIDPETGLEKRTMRFLPARNATNPLPASIHTIIVEEASMLSVELYEEIEAALVHPVQWIFIGDIQQLPPVFGSAILGFKMIELPVVELTQVYRQALESPIIRLAHRILSGKPIEVAEFPEWKSEGKLTLHPWKKKLHEDTALSTLAAFFTSAIDKGAYDVDNDMILIPYNKACGTLELNKHIANHLARRRNAYTYEVMAGFNKHYFSVGDKLLYDREDAEIVEIRTNPGYTGGRVQHESKHLDYWGHNPKAAEESWEHGTSAQQAVEDVDFMLSAIADSEDRVTVASHILVVRLLDSGREIDVSKAADVNSLLLSYALTVHKSQGSEWRKVFFCLHQSHASMLQRELTYTGVTRAREELYIICEPDSLKKGIVNQKIKGNTLREKAEFFKGKKRALERLGGRVK